MMVKAVIFDLGNVLIDFDHSIAVKRLSSLCTIPSTQIYDFFFGSALTGMFEEGKISPREFFLQAASALNIRLAYEEFLPLWNEIFFQSEENRAVHALAKNLKSNYTVALLSNINTLHFEYLKKNYFVFDAFHELFLSFALKLKKPDPLIYKKVLDTLALSPQEAFYTDDRPELVEGARRMGIHAFVFAGVDRLKKDLSGSGIRV
jgi:putative hydrolase of the HAD superfamily